VRGFPARSGNLSVQDGLFHEYKKYGKVTVHVVSSADDRHAVVTFKKYVVVVVVVAFVVFVVVDERIRQCLYGRGVAESTLKR